MKRETDSEAGAPNNAVDRRMERVANALAAAASGGVFGLLLSGLTAMARGQGQGSPAALTWVLAVAFAVVLAVLSRRLELPALPVAPGAAWGVTLTASALLLTLAVFLSQVAYTQAVGGAGRVQLPLPIWPVAQAALLLSMGAVVAGVAAALAGWAQLVRRRGHLSGGNWVALSVLIGGAWGGLALACYLTGHGFGVVW
jgi:hypothetical protein